MEFRSRVHDDAGDITRPLRNAVGSEPPLGVAVHEHIDLGSGLVFQNPVVEILILGVNPGRSYVVVTSIAECDFHIFESHPSIYIVICKFADSFLTRSDRYIFLDRYSIGIQPFESVAHWSILTDKRKSIERNLHFVAFLESIVRSGSELQAEAVFAVSRLHVVGLRGFISIVGIRSGHRIGLHVFHSGICHSHSLEPVAVKCIFTGRGKQAAEFLEGVLLGRLHLRDAQCRNNIFLGKFRLDDCLALCLYGILRHLEGEVFFRSDKVRNPVRLSTFVFHGELESRHERTQDAVPRNRFHSLVSLHRHRRLVKDKMSGLSRLRNSGYRPINVLVNVGVFQ